MKWTTIISPFKKNQSTAEVAKHFSGLDAEQTGRVLDYCQHELLSKFQSLPESSEPFFEKPRGWRLSIYDHNGEIKTFDYAIYRQSINRIEKGSGIREGLKENQVQFSWSTEIPMAKLYSALEKGESLSSLYIRINDVIFSPEIEKQLLDVDIMEDPLIRCLFTGVFGTYQIAQLKKMNQAKNMRNV